jgi:hypothetical protein
MQYGISHFVFEDDNACSLTQKANFASITLRVEKYDNLLF